MRKTARMLVLLLLMTAVLFGCAAKDKESESESELPEYSIELYYVHQSYIETGNENEGILYRYQQKLYCEEGKQYEEAINMLKTVPGDVKDIDTAVTDEISYHKVYVEKGTAYVDIKSGEVTGGSLEETLYISQIVQTLTDSFGEISQVQFLIDGEVTESIMGHCDVTEPYMEGIFTSVK